jgi:phage-related protein
MIETGVHFDNIHSFLDLNLVLSKVEISPAEPKTTYVDIPGGDGSLDLTEALGEVKYSDRDIKFTFTVHPTDEMTFDEKCTQVANALNGKRCEKITLDRDAEYYWQGRCTVNSYAQDKRLKQIVVSAVVSPYKLKQNVTVINCTPARGGLNLVLQNSRKSVVPTIETTVTITVTFKGNRYSLNAGTHKLLDICLTEGNNSFNIIGNEGTVTFTYQEGDL